MKLIDDNCRARLGVYSSPDLAVSTETGDAIWMVFTIAECCRQHNEFGAASRLIGAIETSSLAHGDYSISAAALRHRDKIDRKDSSPIPDDLIAQSPPIWPKEISVLPEASVSPNWIQKGFNFALAITSWAASGFKTRTAEQINKRLEICRACPELVDDHCQKCGCTCVEANRLINKLALATEKCPIGKWD